MHKVYNQFDILYLFKRKERYIKNYNIREIQTIIYIIRNDSATNRTCKYIKIIKNSVSLDI